MLFILFNWQSTFDDEAKMKAFKVECQEIADAVKIIM
jgi:hypothetical protein